MPAVYNRDKGGEVSKKDVSSSKGGVPTTWKDAGWIDFTIERAAGWIGQQANDESVTQPSSSVAKDENDATAEAPAIDKYERKKAKKLAKKQKKLFYKIAREAAAKAMLLYFQMEVVPAAKELEKRTMKTRVFSRKCEENEKAWDDWAS